MQIYFYALYTECRLNVCLLLLLKYNLFNTLEQKVPSSVNLHKHNLFKSFTVFKFICAYMLKIIRVVIS